MGCANSQKVVFATYMLEGDAEHWWRGAKSWLESSGTKIIWEVFLTTYFDKFFPNSLKNEQEAEFIQLK